MGKRIVFVTLQMVTTSCRNCWAPDSQTPHVCDRFVCPILGSEICACVWSYKNKGQLSSWSHIVCTCCFVSEVHFAFQMYLRGYLMYNMCKLCSCRSHCVLRRVLPCSHVHAHVCAVRHTCLNARGTHLSPSPNVLPPFGLLGLHAHSHVGALRLSCTDSKSMHLSPSPYALRPALFACVRTHTSEPFAVRVFMQSADV